MTIDTEYSSFDDVFFYTDRYVADNSIFIQAWNKKDGPIATLTVCLEDRLLGKDETYLDTNNCPWVVDFMVKNGLAKLTGKYRVSGFCSYPAAKINLNEVKKYKER